MDMSRVTCQNFRMSLRHAILGLLAGGPASGYELTKQFDLSLANVWSARHSQSYPELQKMAAAGWVEAGDEGARGRKEYEITADGRAELERWLTSPLPERTQRNELLLRVFFLWTLPDEEAERFLLDAAARAREIHQRLDALDVAVPWDDTRSDLMGRLVLEQGLRVAATIAEWANWAAGQIHEGNDALHLTDRSPTQL